MDFETEGDHVEDTPKWMTWSGDKDPNDFSDWSIDSEGNFFMDIPLSDTEKDEGKSEKEKEYETIDDEDMVTRLQNIFFWFPYLKYQHFNIRPQFSNKFQEDNERLRNLEARLDNYDDYDSEYGNNSKSATDLSENLLMEGLNHRKIRNIEEKIEFLKKDDQVVAEIVRQFCPKPSTTTAPLTTEAPEQNGNEYF